jgi:hypothetical protein
MRIGAVLMLLFIGSCGVIVATSLAIEPALFGPSGASRTYTKGL